MTTVPFIPPVGIAGPAVPFVDAAAAGALAAGETLFPEAQAAQAQAAELASAHQELAILVGGKSRSGRSFQWPHTLIVNGLPVQGSRPETLDRTFFEGNAARISLREILEIFASPLCGYTLSLFDVEWLDRGGFRGRVALTGPQGKNAAQLRFKVRPGQSNPARVQDFGSDLLVDDKGKGLGTILQTQWLLLLRRLGFQQLTVTAGRMGIYYWPSRGFDFRDESMRADVLRDFADYVRAVAGQNVLELTEAQRQTIYGIQHAWELAFLELAWGDIRVPAGRRYLQNPIYNKPVVVRFDLRDDYEGWQCLRRALEKIGQGHLLPDSLGVSQSAGSMENAERR